MKIYRLYDPAPASGGSSAPAAAPTVTTQTVTSNPMAPREPAEPEDNFLDPIVAPPEEKIVVDPLNPTIGPNGEVIPAPEVKPVAPATTYTPEQVAELMKRVPAAAAPAAPAPKPLTPDEIDARLNTFKPAEADINELLAGGQPALAAMGRVGAALVKNAVTVANILAEEKLNKFIAEVQPHIELAQSMQRERVVSDYFGTFPDHVGLDPLISQVATQMVQEGFKGSEKDKMTEVGRRVNDLVGKLKIPLVKPADGAVVPAPAAAVKPAATRMSTVSSGGQGGAGGAGGGDKGKDPEASIWS